MNFQYIFFAFIICSIFNPLAIKIGNKYILDKPNNRKIHTEPKPRSGGIAIYLTLIIFSFFIESLRQILLPMSIIFVIGILDDIYCLSAKVKLFFQFLVATITYFLGYEISIISIGNFYLDFTYLTPLISILWMVGVMNSINLIDGLDGLATSMVLVSSFAFLLTNLNIGIIASLIIGICFAFLRVNIKPSIVFLGDSGSLLLGFMLSVISVKSLISIASPQIIGIVLIIFIPIVDTVWAFIRRILNNKPVFTPDKEHLHHKLLSTPLSEEETLLIMIFVHLIAAILGVLVISWNSIITIFLCSIIIPLTIIMYNFKLFIKFFSSYSKLKEETSITKIDIK